MEEKKVCQDLEEDEELATLRLAALATLKSRNSKKSEPDVVESSNILPINSITRSLADYSSDPTSRGKNWRNNNGQPSRKRQFPKSSQRSNLIVITPVGVDKKSSSTEGNSQLLLPQHKKWCPAGQDNSTSPKNDRRTGPTRFNRHESGSESSDSDFEDSGGDSYSNETILQDELSLLNPEESNEGHTELKNNTRTDHRTSFENLESNLNSKTPSESVYKSTETTNPKMEDIQSEPVLTKAASVAQLDQPAGHVDHSFKSMNSKPSSCLTDSLAGPKDSETVSCTYNSAQVTKLKSKHTPIKFDVPPNTDKKGTGRKDNPRDVSHVFNDLKNHFEAERKSSEYPELTASLLSQNDLRFELKKRKMSNPERLPSGRRKKIVDNKQSTQKVRHSSGGRRYSKRSQSRDRSRTPERKRGRYHKGHFSSSRSSSSSSSSSTSSSSVTSRDSSPRVHSVSSVIQPVQSKVTGTQNNMKSSIGRKPFLSLDTDHQTIKKAIEIKLKPLSNIKISVPGNDPRNVVPEIKKRGPVHMRLGTLPRKRIIQMPKDVEAAFVTTSSDDETDVQCKKSNILVVTEILGKKVDSLPRLNEKKVLEPSDVPKTGRRKNLR